MFFLALIGSALQARQFVNVEGAHGDAIWAVQYTADGRIVSGSLDETVRIWCVGGEGGIRVSEGSVLSFERVAWCVCRREEVESKTLTTKDKSGNTTTTTKETNVLKNLRKIGGHSLGVVALSVDASSEGA